MSSLPGDLFLNPIWHALRLKHKHLAVEAGSARRYPADVVPFAAVARRDRAAFRDLHTLLAPNDPVWLADDGGEVGPGLRIESRLPCLQMVLRSGITPPPAAAPTFDVVPLTAADAADMVALTDVAFPGFFRAKTHVMGAYCGVRIDGELAAMGGERLRIEHYSELSAICTHPKHRGKGLASSIIWHLVRDHRRDGRVSWLHVGAENLQAIQLYRALGFEAARTLTLRRVSRTD